MFELPDEKSLEREEKQRLKNQGKPQYSTNLIGNQVSKPRTTWQWTKYEHHFPHLLLEMMSKGQSKREFCKAIGIGLDAFRKWTDAIPEFKDAYSRGKTAFEAHYERWLWENIHNDQVHTQILRIITRHVAGWKDDIEKKEHIEAHLEALDAEILERLRLKYKSDV